MLLAIILSVGSGLLDASTRITVKTSKLAPFLFLGTGFLCTLPFYAIWLAYTGVPHITAVFWMVIAIHVPLMLLANWLTVKAHRSSHLTTAAPYLSLTVLFLFITSPLMLGTVPTIWGFVGASMIVSGLVFVHTGDSKRLRDLWRNVRREPGVLLLIGVAAIYSITSNLDKIALNASSAPFYLLVDLSLVGIGALAIHAITYSRTRADDTSPDQIKTSSRLVYLPVILFGILVSMATFAHMTALGLTDQVPYVIAGKRAGTVLFASLGGLLLGLMSTHHKGELVDYKRKLIAAAIVIAGTCLVALFG